MTERSYLAVGAGVDNVLDLAVDEVVERVDVLPHQPAQLEEVREQLPLLLHLLHGRRQVVVVQRGGSGRGSGCLLAGAPAIACCLWRLPWRPRHRGRLLGMGGYRDGWMGQSRSQSSNQSIKVTTFECAARFMSTS